MARPIYVPQAGGFINFRDDASDADITAYLTAKYPAQKAPAPAPAAPPPSDVGAWESSGLGWLSRFQSAGGGLAELLGADEYAKYLYEKSQANVDEANKYQPPEDQGTAGWLGDVAIQSAPDLAGGLAASYAGGQIGAAIGAAGGPAAPATIPVAAGIGALIGGVGYGISTAFGGNIQRQAVEQGTDQMGADEGTALIAAVPQGALDALADRVLIGRLLPNGSTTETARRIVGEGVVRSAVKGAGAEGLTEAAQQAIEIGQANPEKLFEFGPEVQEELATAAVAGGFLGGVFGGVSVPIESAINKRRAAPGEQLRNDLQAEAKQGEIEARNAEIAAGTNALLRAKPIGQLKLKASEVSIDPARADSPREAVVTLMAGDKSIASFRSADMADAAVKAYQARTKANVQLNIEDPETGISEPLPDPYKVKINDEAALPEGRVKARLAERQKADTVPFKGGTSAKIDTDPLSFDKLFGQEMTVPPTFEAPAAGQTFSMGEVQAPKISTQPAPKSKPTIKVPEAGTEAMMPPSITTAPLPNPDTPVDISQMPYASVSVEPQAQPGTMSGKINFIAEPKVITLEDQLNAPREPIQTGQEAVQPAPATPTPEAAQSPQAASPVAPVAPQPAPVQNPPTLVRPRKKRTPVWALTKPEAVELRTTGTISRPSAITGANVQEDPAVRKAQKDRIDTVTRSVEQRLGGLSPTFKAKLVDAIKVHANSFRLVARGEMRVDDNGDIIIDLSSDIYDPSLTVEEMTKRMIDTLNHEVIHGLKQMGLFTPREWSILTKAARSVKRPGKKYTYFDRAVGTYVGIASRNNLSHADANALFEEEAVAEMFREWAKNPQAAPVQTRGLLNRILQTIKRLFSGLKAAEYTEVFKQIESGDVGKRTPQPQTQTVAPRYSVAPVSPGAPMSDDLSDRQDRSFGLYPYLRTASPRYYDHPRKILGATNPGNARRQIEALDQLLAAHPNTLASDAAFAEYLADAAGKLATPQTGVPMVPYRAVQFANNPQLIAQQLGRMSQGQLELAEEGLMGAAFFENAYRSGKATPVHTAKLILWGILSRGVSPYVQESMFLDVVRPTGKSNRTGADAGGIDPFILDAIEGTFDVDAYMDYVKTLKVDGLPGAGTTHNLGAFGKTTLVKLQERIPDGRTILQYLHDLMSDYSLSGKEIRRRFHEVNNGIGINNKVLSFMMLVSGRDDVLVLDRVQMRNQFNDGRFDNYNLYDGEKIEKEVTSNDGTTSIKAVTDTGTGIAPIGDGAFGLMYYEALERDLMPAIRQAYAMLGRGNQFSMGRYHWESWVASSAQEVDHGSITGLTNEALGEADPYGGIYTAEGKYDTFNAGVRYGYTNDGEAYAALPDGLGDYYYFTPEYAKKVIKGYQKRSTGIIRGDSFKVSESTEGPWYDRPEIDKSKLRQYLIEQTRLFADERGRTVQRGVQASGAGDPSRSGPGPVHSVRRRKGGVRQPQVGEVASTARSIADKYISQDGARRFSVAPPVGSEEFKYWFGNSAIRNPDGTPRVVYHGTKASARNFKEFDTKQSELGTHFGTQSQASDFVRDVPSDPDDDEFNVTDRVYPVYLSIQNPLRMRDYGKWTTGKTARRLNEMGILSDEKTRLVNGMPINHPVAISEIQDAIRAAGYDGIVYLNRHEGEARKSDKLDRSDMTDEAFAAKYPEAQDSYIIFRPEQAKSIFNNFPAGESFSPRFSVAPALGTDEFKLWFKNSAVKNPDGTPMRVFHGTNARVRFAVFDTGASEMGSHFGTIEQATKFVMLYDNEARSGGRIYPVYLSIQNPIRLTDVGNWDNDKVAAQLRDRGIIDDNLLNEAVSNFSNAFGEFKAREAATRKKLQQAMRKAGYDGIVYLNRVEGIPYDIEKTLWDAGVDRDWTELSDGEFKQFIPESRDSYIAFDPRQVKSVFNEFNAGEAKRRSFSLSPTHAEVPLTGELAAQNSRIFAGPPVEKSFRERMMEFFFGSDIRKGSFPQAFRVNIIDQDAQVLRKEMEANLAGNVAGARGEKERLNANYSAYVALQMAARASHVAASAINNGALKINMTDGTFDTATVSVDADGDNIANIIKTLLNGPPDANGNPTSLMDHFRAYAVAKRGARLELVNGKEIPVGITAQYRREAFDAAQRYPQIRDAFEMYQRFNKKLMKAALDAEVITQDQFRSYTDNMDYYGFYREFGEEMVAQPGGFKVAGKIVVKPYNGSTLGNLAGDPMMVMIHNVNFWTGAIMRNIAAKKSFKLLNAMGEASLLGPGQEPDQTAGYQPEVMYFRDKGITKRYAVKDYLLTKALGSEDRLNMPRLFELMNVPTNVLRQAITRDPRFVVTNMIRDTVSSWILRGESVKPFISTIKGYKQALDQDASYQALERRGIVGAYDESMKDARGVSEDLKRRVGMGRITSADQAVRYGLRKTWDKLGEWSDASDAASRIPIYEAVLAETGDEAEAAFRALEVINFSRRGASQALGLLAKTIPFLNARIQGFDVVAQGVASGYRAATGQSRGERDATMGRRVLIRGMMYAAVAMALEILNDDDEAYEQLPSYIKDSNLLIPLGDGLFIPVAKPFEAGLIFGTIPQRVYQTATGQVGMRDNLALFWDQVGSTFGLNPIPQAALPLMENIFNTDMYTGQQIISDGKLRLDPSLQYNAGTSKLARILGNIPLTYDFTKGEFEGIAPAYIDNLITGYGGPIGTYMLAGVDMILGQINAGPSQLPTPMLEMPGIRSFLIDANNRNPKAVAEAYELFRIVDETNRTLSRLKKMGEFEAAAQYVQDNRGALQAKKAVMRMVEVLNNVQAMERRIEQNQTMNREEKLAELQKLREFKVRATARVKELSSMIR